MAGHRHRVFCDQASAGKTATVTGDEFHHLVRVLRAKPGMEVELFNGKGAAFQGRVVRVDKASASVQIEGELPDCEPAPRLRLALAWAVCKAKAMDLVLQKSTELGVSELRPFIASHSVVKPRDCGKTSARWRKITIEAAKQCGRTFLPQLHSASSFQELLSAVPGYDCAVLLHPEAPVRLRDILIGRELKNILLLVGPEGGFTEEEVGRAEDARVRGASLGSETLREETACIAAVSAVNYQFH